MAKGFPPVSLTRSRGLVPGLTISALGDSISTRATYFPCGTSLAGIQNWAPNTPYVQGNLRMNGGLLYGCTAPGTSAGSGGPTGMAQSGITDGGSGLTWMFMPYQVNKTATSYLKWTELFSGGALRWDQSQGYQGIAGGLTGVLTTARGHSYVNGTDTVTFTQGAAGTLNIDADGGINQLNPVTITDPGGASFNSAFGYTINSATGSGGSLSLVAQVGGTFGVPGCFTRDMVARLPGACASSVDIFVVHGGTNDLASQTFSTITGNLRTCYETLTAAGKRVIAMPITQRTNNTGVTYANYQLLTRVNNWIRAYARKEVWANPLGITIGYADPTPYWQDGTNREPIPIGNSSGSYSSVNGAMTTDGLHPSVRGAQIEGIVIVEAAKSLIGATPLTTRRAAWTDVDGYDPVLNPGGNLLEAADWNALENVTVGMRRNSGGNYICSQNGQTSSASPPTGTGTGIIDGGAKWNFLRNDGASMFRSGAKALTSPPSGISYSGNIANGWNLGRNHGSASGNIYGYLESPYSDGHAGTRQVLGFDLSGGDNAEAWIFYFADFTWTAGDDSKNIGILASDLGPGGALFSLGMEIELSYLLNVTQVSLMLCDLVSGYSFRYLDANGNFPGSGTSLTMMNTDGEMLRYPNGGKIRPATTAAPLPSNLSNLTAALLIGFDTSAAHSRALIKINQADFKKAGAA